MNRNEIGKRQPGTGNREPATASEPAFGLDGYWRSCVRPSGCVRHRGFGIAALSGAAHAQPLSPRNTQPYKSAVYNVAFSYPKEDWVAVPAAGGNIALLMQKKGEASLALDYQVLRVALAPDEIDDTFKEIESTVTQRRHMHALMSSALNELGGNKVVVIRYGASGLTGDLDVTQYSVVSGASLYRLTCASTRATATKHVRACETVVRTLAVSKK